MDSAITKTLETFFGKFTRLTYGKGAIILRAEDAPQGVLYLKKGYVRQYMVDESGTTLMLHMFKPNSFFPLTWVVNDEPNRYYLEAVTPVELWRAPKKAVRENSCTIIPRSSMIWYTGFSRVCAGTGTESNSWSRVAHIKRRPVCFCI